MKICNKKIRCDGESGPTIISFTPIKDGMGFNILYFPDCTMSF